MSLNYQQVHEQVKKLGENASSRQQHLKNLRERAKELLLINAKEIEHLRHKVLLASRSDQTLRCALPVEEALDAHFALPPMPAQATIVAADGSQIAPNRHAEVEYCLVNVGVIQLCYGTPQAPETLVKSRLLYDEQLYTRSGTITDASLALQRDVEERTVLAELASTAEAPVITFTDGPMELWGAKEEGGSSFSDRLAEYHKALHRLAALGAATAGYVDKPAANLVVRLLEVALTPEEGFKDLANLHPLQGRPRPGALPRAAASGRALGGVCHAVEVGCTCMKASWLCISSISTWARGKRTGWPG